MPSSLADRLEAARRQRFVGRQEERTLFQGALASADLPFSVLYIFGPGGVGKSSLLREYAALAARNDMPASFLDGRNIEPRPDSFLSALAESLPMPSEAALTDFLAGLAARTVIFIDTAELLTPLHRWLWEEFLPQLPDSVLVVLAGRHPPAVGWRSDLGWQAIMRVISLRYLDPSESRAYLVRCQVPAQAHETVLEFTHGHPLALSLVADVFAQSPELEFRPERTPDVVQTLMEQFLDEASGPNQRRALEACALVRLTTESLLAALLQEPDSASLFEWLQGLSFVESEPGGLFPHDLAREAIAAGLRWRKPEWYETLHARARNYYTSRMEQQRDPRVQRQMLSDLIYLHRRNPAVSSYFEWQSTGLTYTDAFQPEDRAAILAMVEAHEGPASAGLAANWLDRQPEGVSVFRQSAGDVQGFLLTLSLERCAEADREKDPGARQAWAFLQERAPLRQGECAILFRFWMADDAYQDVSPIQSRIFLNMVQYYLVTPGLAYSLLPCANPEFWRPAFTYADLHRLSGADYVVGGHSYGVWGHDWRAVPPMTWLALLAEREMGAAVTPASERPADPLLVLSESDFAEAVRQALRDYADPAALQGNPLLRSRLVVEGQSKQIEPAARAEQLRQLLLQTAEPLKASQRQTRMYQALFHTYFQPALTQEQAAELLDIPYGSFRRYLRAGIQYITDQLWARETG